MPISRVSSGMAVPRSFGFGVSFLLRAPRVAGHCIMQRPVSYTTGDRSLHTLSKEKVREFRSRERDRNDSAPAPEGRSTLYPCPYCLPVSVCLPCTKKPVVELWCGHGQLGD